MKKIYLSVLITSIYGCNVCKKYTRNDLRFFSTEDSYKVYASEFTKNCLTNYDFKEIEKLTDSSWVVRPSILWMSERYVIKSQCAGIWTYHWTGKRYLIGVPEKGAVLRYNDTLFLLKNLAYSERVQHCNLFYAKYKRQFKKTEWVDIKRTILRGVFIEKDSTRLLR